MRLITTAVQVLGWIAAAARADVPLLYLPLDGDVSAAISAGGSRPLGGRSDALQFEKGVRGLAVKIDGDLRWPARSCINVRAGTVAFWIKPDWNAAELKGAARCLFSLYGAKELKQPWLTNRLSLTAAPGGTLSFTMYDSSSAPKVSLRHGIAGWKADQWHHLAIAWEGINSGSSEAVCRLYVDGNLVDQSKPARIEIGPTGEMLDLGRDSDSSPDYAQAYFDEFYIYGRALTAQEIRRAQDVAAAETPALDPAAAAAPAGWWDGRWPYRAIAKVPGAEYGAGSVNKIYRLPMDLQLDLAAMGAGGRADPGSIRLVACDAQTGKSMVGARPIPAIVDQGEISFQWPHDVGVDLPNDPAVAAYFGVTRLDWAIPLQVRTLRTDWPITGPAASKLTMPDYATDAYGEGWDFNRDGDFCGIDFFGVRPDCVKNRQVKGGVLSFDVEDDPYFGWGNLWSATARTKRPVAIDLAKYPVLEMRVRQSCPQAEWEIFARAGQSMNLLNHKFTVKGTGWQVIRIDLARDLRWSGVLKALRIDPTSHVKAHIEFDWIRLCNQQVVARGPVEALPASGAKIASLQLEVEHSSAPCGSGQVMRAIARDAGNKPVAGQPVTLRLRTAGDARLEGAPDGRTLALEETARRGITDECGVVQAAIVHSRRAAAAADAVAADADFTDVKSPTIAVTTLAGPAHHLAVGPRKATIVQEKDFPLRTRIQVVDQFDNPLPVAGRRVRLSCPPGATIKPAEVVTDAQGAAEAELSIDSNRSWVGWIAAEDGALAGRSADMTVALASPRPAPVRLMPNGYFASGDKPMVPLGGFYANWVQLETPDGEWGVLKQFTETDDAQKRAWLKFLSESGTTVVRLMLRTHHPNGTESMDIGGKVNQPLLAQVIHYMDLAREFGIKFHLVIHEDYEKPVYFNPKHLRQFSLPLFDREELATLAPEQARFVRDHRLIAPINAKYTDPDVIACQDRYVRELIPALRNNPQVFAYELENEMVACPVDWSKHATDVLRTLDPQTLVCASHGGGGLHTADPLWWLRGGGIDFYTYHLYPHEQSTNAEIDYGAAVDVLARYGRMSGPAFLGESAGDQFKYHPDVETRRRVMRDIIWLSLTNGNPGVFFWNARGPEVREFKLARDALARLDLAKLRRARPAIAIDVSHPLKDDLWYRTPEGRQAYAMMGRYAQHYLSAGVDVDFTFEPQKYPQHCTLEKFVPAEAREKLFSVTPGWQVAYLLDRSRDQALIYVRNFSGSESWMAESGRQKWKQTLRTVRSAPLRVNWRLGEGGYLATVYDLTRQTAHERELHSTDSIDLGTSDHDFAIVLRRK